MILQAGPNGEMPKWEDPPSAQILNALIQIKNQFLQDMQMVAAFQDIQADPNVAARTVGAAIEQARARWQSFLGDLSEFHSGLMRHCLMLVAQFQQQLDYILICAAVKRTLERADAAGDG